MLEFGGHCKPGRQLSDVRYCGAGDGLPASEQGEPRVAQSPGWWT
jgi:hypothetical protein